MLWGRIEIVLYCCVTWSLHSCHYHTLRQAQHSFLTRCIGRKKQNDLKDNPISYLETLRETGSESIEETLRKMVKYKNTSGVWLPRGDRKNTE